MASSEAATQHDSLAEVDETLQVPANREGQSQQQQQTGQDESGEHKPNIVEIGGATTTTNNTATSEDDYMDYDSDEDDDDAKSNHSGSSPTLNANLMNGSGKQSSKSKGQSHKDEDRRAHHNVLERRRRDHLKDSFSQLRDSVPTFRSERASRTEILVQAADFIKSRVEQNTLMQQELDALLKENRRLEEANENKAPV